VGFEPTISAGERPQTYALNLAVTATGREGGWGGGGRRKRKRRKKKNKKKKEEEQKKKIIKLCVFYFGCF
jgi:hypothetical protein